MNICNCAATDALHDYVQQQTYYMILRKLGCCAIASADIAFTCEGHGRCSRSASVLTPRFANTALPRSWTHPTDERGTVGVWTHPADEHVVRPNA